MVPWPYGMYVPKQREGATANRQPLSLPDLVVVVSRQFFSIPSLSLLLSEFLTQVYGSPDPLSSSTIVMLLAQGLPKEQKQPFQSSFHLNKVDPFLGDETTLARKVMIRTS